MFNKLYNIFAKGLVQGYSNSLERRLKYSYAPDIIDRYKELPLFLNSWQAVCMIDEIKLNKILSKNIMGEDIVIWKDDNNKISVMQAHCPHLGAHLASGGDIFDNNIRCAFHHHCFDSKGQCTNKKKEKIFTYPLNIQGGIVFAWFHAEKKEPTWTLPNLFIDENNREWTTSHAQLNGTRVPSHPMTFIENGADINHGIKLHNLCHKDTEFNIKDEEISLKYIREKEEKGHIKLTAYGPFILSYDFEFTYRLKGYSRMLMLLQLMPDGSFIAHRIKMKQKDIDTWYMRMFYFGVSIVTEFKLFKAFITEDQLIMINRKYVDKPNYDKEDMFIPKFRKWYKQFYPIDKKKIKPLKKVA